MIAFRFLFAIIFLKLFGIGYGFLLDRCHRFSSATSMQSFDFSSATGWDEFYKKTGDQDQKVSQDVSLSIETRATEWHSSVSLQDIASVVPPGGKCLIIGCGDSFLPDVILQQRNRPPPSSLVLLDTSKTCLTQLRERHERMGRSSSNHNGTKQQVILSNTDIEYVCGDVTQLSNYFCVDNINKGKERAVTSKEDRKVDTGGQLFDIIIDKGLTDALLCGEGWDGPLEKLMYESAKVLSMETGQYLLISYELPSSTKEFLVDTGKTVGLTWDFDFDLAASMPHDGVSVAMARKTAPTNIL